MNEGQMAKILFLFFAVFIIFLYFHSKNTKHPNSQPFKERTQFDITPFSQIFQDLTIFPWNGTLLGCVKNKMLIPWENAVEFAVISQDKQKLLSFLNLSSSKDKIIIKRGETICVFHIISNDNLFYPVIPTTIEDIPIKIPQNYHEILLKLYGGGYEKTCFSSSFDYTENKPYENIVKTPCENIITYNNSLFDNVWVINLKSRQDRWKLTSDRLGKIGITPKRWDAIDAKSKPLIDTYNSYKKPQRNKGEVACFLSHYSLWEKLYEDNVSSAVIFEDDIILSPEVSKTKILEVCNDGTGASIIFLGYCLGTPRFKTPETSLGEGMCLHAYVVSRKGLELLLAWVRKHYMYAIDHLTYNFCRKEMCVITKTPDNLPKGIFGDGLIIQDRSNLGTNIGGT